MVKFYSTPERVIQFTGCKPSDFGLATGDELADMLTGWLVEVKDLIDADRNRDYHEEPAGVPAGIHHIALRMAANMVAQAMLRRETPVVRVDDFAVRMVEDSVFTNAIKSDLSKYPRKFDLRVAVVPPSI